MGWYDKYILPKLIDTACSQPPMTRLRARYVAQATGDVLEIGIGSGLNLAHYSDDVRSITGVDPAAELTQIARRRASERGLPVEVIGVSGEELPAESNSFDSIVCTWTLCTIPNPYRAVDEMRRVLKPGGQLIFVEHGKSDDRNIAKWQRRVEPLWKKIGGGCHLTRRADELLADGGFRIESFESGYEEGPKIAAFMMHGLASAR
ncbi:MAG: class I SAM-dependent methyltransferase [Pseudomonadaceae bacterium]|nr:class I SAM-dependent methyltransferase [Pseudomonadaceae bacterium]